METRAIQHDIAAAMLAKTISAQQTEARLVQQNLARVEQIQASHAPADVVPAQPTDLDVTA